MLHVLMFDIGTKPSTQAEKPDGGWREHVCGLEMQLCRSGLRKDLMASLGITT